MSLTAWNSGKFFSLCHHLVFVHLRNIYFVEIFIFFKRMKYMKLSLGLFFIIHYCDIAKGLQCYKFGCWGDECFGFEERRDELVDKCPTDAQGCLFSFGTVKHDSNSDSFMSRWNQRGKPLRRETRSCWVPSHSKYQVPKSESYNQGDELGNCYPTTMNQWLPFEGRMVIVNSFECICSSGNLCNGKVMSRNSSPASTSRRGGWPTLDLVIITAIAYIDTFFLVLV